MYSKLFDNAKGRHIWPKRTICEVHRELYDLLCMAHHEKNWDMIENSVGLLEEAYTAGLKMTAKLVENKCAMPDWEVNTPDAEKIRLRQLRIHLMNELQGVQP